MRWADLPDSNAASGSQLLQEVFEHSGRQAGNVHTLRNPVHPNPGIPGERSPWPLATTENADDLCDTRSLFT